MNPAKPACSPAEEATAKLVADLRAEVIGPRKEVESKQLAARLSALEARYGKLCADVKQLLAMADAVNVSNNPDGKRISLVTTRATTPGPVEEERNEKKYA